MKPLDVVDGRIPCPTCGAQADLTEETLTILLPGVRRTVPVWECPSCREKFAALTAEPVA